MKKGKDREAKIENDWSIRNDAKWSWIDKWRETLKK